MELLFVTILAFAFGLGLHYLLRGREEYGVLVLPSLTAATTAIIWVALVWAGWKFDGGWIWTVSLIVGLIPALVVGLVLPRRRRAADDALMRRLSRA